MNDLIELSERFMIYIYVKRYKDIYITRFYVKRYKDDSIKTYFFYTNNIMKLNSFCFMGNEAGSYRDFFYFPCCT